MRLSDLVECIRMINCMGYAEFEEVFQDDAPYLRNKLNLNYQCDVSKWLCYLDNINLRRLEKHLIYKQSLNETVSSVSR